MAATVPSQGRRLTPSSRVSWSLVVNIPFHSWTIWFNFSEGARHHQRNDPADHHSPQPFLINDHHLLCLWHDGKHVLTTNLKVPAGQGRCPVERTSLLDRCSRSPPRGSRPLRAGYDPCRCSADRTAPLGNNRRSAWRRGLANRQRPDKCRPGYSISDKYFDFERCPHSNTDSVDRSQTPPPSAPE